MKAPSSNSRIFTLITILGVVFFCYQLWVFANSQRSIGDEGSYLFKGYMFVRGDYYPFQENAFWTNKAPLAFIIPGYIQYWFGPGLREGRYFAILLGVLMMLGVWIVSNRLAGKAWATLTVLVFTLSSHQTAILSQAISQGLVACLLTWVFVLVLGDGRRTWHLVVGSIVSVLVLMTRQNMLPVPIFLVAYIFWQHGKKAGWLSLTAVILTFLFFYLYYGPKLLDLWLDWLPNLQTPFDKVIATSQDTGTGFEITRAISRVQSFISNIHDHFAVVVGSISALILWRSPRKWGNDSQYKTASFLGVLYFVLFLMHVWASIFNSYCVWCLQSYQVFYNPVGILFVVLCFSSYKGATKYQQYILSAFFVFVSGCLGLYYYYGWSGWLLKKILLPLPTRLFSEGQFYTVPLRDVLTYQFSIPAELQERGVSFTGGVVVGILFLVLVWGLWKIITLKKGTTTYSFFTVFLAGFLFVGIIAPIILDGSIAKTPCGIQFLSNYEQTGIRLSDHIPSDTLLYWNGSGRQLAFILYMTDVKIFPQQIHAGGGNYKTEDDNIDELLKIGRFNSKIDSQWREQASYHVLWSENFTENAQSFFDQPSYERVPFDMEELGQCEDQLFVFKKR